MTPKEIVKEKYPEAEAFIMLDFIGWVIFQSERDKSKSISELQPTSELAWQSAYSRLKERV